MALIHMRKDYQSGGLLEADAGADPFALFHRWFDEAVAAQVPEPNAMTLATATRDGVPSARIVLLKGLDARGFDFFTNYESRKGRELAANPKASLVFFWAPLERQVRIDGTVERVTPLESDEYFAVRPRGSRIGAWASPQSQVIPDRSLIESNAERFAAMYPGEAIPRPTNWGGFRLVPSVMEFWQGRASRLHDRLQYTRLPDGPWSRVRLGP
ncbi:MAG: pyridoxamine 5'-phosphate oxidase [Gemmataceae bacterium]|nr:pyridoxamine 5'-phosphate oxidase [Gemmataceae bacterium]